MPDKALNSSAENIKTRNKQIYIIGNPNTGKTTLFNQLTGLKQKVGNWAGVTVDKKQGEFKTNSFTCEATDLPGIYSLPYNYCAINNNLINTEQAIDEQIAANALLNPKKNQPIDCVINIIDASNLHRNLYLTTQLRDLNIPMIIVINMMDIAKKSGLIIDCKTLSAELSCPVIPISARKKQGLKQLKQELDSYLLQTINFNPKQQTHNKPWQIHASKLAPITRLINNKFRQSINDITNIYWQSICLLNINNTPECQDNIFYKTYSAKEQQIIQKNSLSISENKNIDLLIAEKRNQFIAECIKKTQKKCGKAKAMLTDYLDSIILNKFLGLPIFLMIMYLMFEFSMTFGSALQPIFDDGSRAIFINGATALSQYLGLPNWFSTILSEGVGLGINTVLTFIPQIATLFLFLTFLEDSGYMARAAFVMDRLMQWVGLPGKAFVPLIVGFGCNVPSIMAARHLDSHRDRLLTIIMAPFITCGARLAIFAVFTSAFFPDNSGLIMFLLYIIGLVIAIFTGLIMKKTILKGNKSPFIMEMPVYHLPSIKILTTLTWQKLRGFVLKAGKLIIPICIILGTLNNIKLSNSNESYLEKAGKIITPVFQPIGIEQNNWQATVGLITGTLAKEVVVGSLNTLYSKNSQNIAINTQANTQAGTSLNNNILQQIKEAWENTIVAIQSISMEQIIHPLDAVEADHDMSQSSINHMGSAFQYKLNAFCYLLFVLLYIPCVSTIAATYREASKAYAWLSTIWSISIAYTIAGIFYQIGSWSLGRSSSIHMGIYSGLMLLYLILFIISLRILANNKSIFAKSNSANLKLKFDTGCSSGCGSNCTISCH